MNKYSMKQGVNTHLSVLLDGITDYWDSLDKIEVAFSQFKNGKIIKKDVWRADSTGTITRNGDIIYIPWTRAETKLFNEDSAFYMDIRPTLLSGDDIRVEPTQLVMTWTLFEE